VNKHEPLDLLDVSLVGGQRVCKGKPVDIESPGHVGTKDNLGQIVDLGEKTQLPLFLPFYHHLLHPDASQVEEDGEDHERPRGQEIILWEILHLWGSKPKQVGKN